MKGGSGRRGVVATAWLRCMSQRRAEMRGGDVRDDAGRRRTVSLFSCGQDHDSYCDDKEQSKTVTGQLIYPNLESRWAKHCVIWNVMTNFPPLSCGTGTEARFHIPTLSRYTEADTPDYPADHHACTMTSLCESWAGVILQNWVAKRRACRNNVYIAFHIKARTFPMKILLRPYNKFENFTTSTKNK